VAEFLILLYWDDDANIRAIRNRFFKPLLPILALTFSFLPYEQPLQRTDNANSGLEEESEIYDYSDEEEEKLFHEWKEHWMDLEEDQMSEAAETNVRIEVINGQRVYDDPLGGKDLATLIQVASKLGFNAEVEQVLELLVTKLEQVTPERCHAILPAFFDTMLMQKIGRVTLEKHEADFRAMLCSYVNRYLVSPTADLARPRVACRCVRCKRLNKFLEDSKSESKSFVIINEGSGDHLHLLKQIQMAGHRFTWEYRYGPKDERSGEMRGRFPDDWSHKLRKQFPKRWIANKGYEYTTGENEQVKELTITKTDTTLTLARETFKERLTDAKGFGAKVEGSKVGIKFWKDAIKSIDVDSPSQPIDLSSIPHKLLAAEAGAEHLIAGFAQEVAITPVHHLPLPVSNQPTPAKGPQTIAKARAPGFKSSTMSPGMDGIVARALNDLQSPQQYQNTRVDTRSRRNDGSSSQEQSEIDLRELAKRRGNGTATTSPSGSQVPSRFPAVSLATSALNSPPPDLQPLIAKINGRVGCEEFVRTCIKAWKLCKDNELDFGTYTKEDFCIKKLVDAHPSCKTRIQILQRSRWELGAKQIWELFSPEELVSEPFLRKLSKFESSAQDLSWEEAYRAIKAERERRLTASGQKRFEWRPSDVHDAMITLGFTINNRRALSPKRPVSVCLNSHTILSKPRDLMCLSLCRGRLKPSNVSSSRTRTAIVTMVHCPR